MSLTNETSGIAALAIAESTLLALQESGVLTPAEISGVLRDAAAAHENRTGTEDELAMHRNVVATINHIAAGRNSIRL